LSSYAPTNWQDYPSLATAISAARLNNMESGIQAAYRVGSGGLTNADIANGAAIAYSKLALTGQIVNADIAAAAAISYSKLQLAAAILNSDIANAAAIDLHKLNIPNDATKVALGDGTWGAPPAGGGGAVGSQLDYAQITANSAVITVTTEATALAIVTGNSVSYDGTKVRIEFFASSLTAAGSAIPTWVVFRDAAGIGQVKNSTITGGTTVGPLSFAVFDTPPAGAHTYSIRAFVAASANTTTVNAGAGGAGTQVPAYLRVTKA
jgi:hypothetical protein